VFKPTLIERSCRTPAYQGLKRAGRGMQSVLHTRLEPDAFDLVRKAMDAIMHGSIDPDLLNREGGYGASSSFSFRHNDPDGLNAGLHFLLLLGWRSRESGRVVDPPTPLHPCVKRALAVLSRHDANQPLPALARQCGVSESHLSRIFHRQIGVPLTRYRNSLRLARFWEVYRVGDQKNLSEAVYEAGFGSYARFYKVFVQHYGTGPRASLAVTESATRRGMELAPSTRTCVNR
jgi:AraC-like DNA-binding protein